MVKSTATNLILQKKGMWNLVLHVISDVCLPCLHSWKQTSFTHYTGWLGGNERRLNIVTTYNLLYNASLLVEDMEDGYVLCLDGIINTTGNSPLCFRPLEPKLEVALDFVWKKYQLFPKHAEYFLNLVQKEIKNYQK